MKVFVEESFVLYKEFKRGSPLFRRSYKKNKFSPSMPHHGNIQS